MKLYEYQAKRLFKEKGIPVLKGEIASSPQEAFAIAQELDKGVAVKAQVLVGGRGKSGGIILAKSPQEAKQASSQILGKDIKGLVVKKVLVEEATEFVREFYLGITVDRSQRRNILIFTTEGGVDIEEIALRHPEAIFRYSIAPTQSIEKILEDLKKEAALDDEVFNSLRDIVKKLYQLYFQLDCELAEINPLVLTTDNRLVALDAKIIVDDNALFRQEKITSWREEVETDDIEREAHRRKIAYVRLNGDIGIIGNGAGLVMATMDEIKYAGGSPANFLDIGGGAKRELVENALEIILMDSQIKGIFMNIFGGITRCDEVAQAIISVFSQREAIPPVVIRLHGTRSKEAKSLLRSTKFSYVESMEEGAKRIVELVEKIKNEK